MHLGARGFVHAELIDPETHAAVAMVGGAEGELVLTHLRHRAAPLLRFRTRDHVVVRTSPCPCGRTGPRLRCLGRTDDMLIVRGVNVFPSQIEHALLRLEGLAPHYQLVLTTRSDRQDELTVRVEPLVHPAAPDGGSSAEAGSPGAATIDASDTPDGDRAALAGRARAALHDILGLQVVVDLVAPGTIPRSEGKAVRVLDQRLR
jgi:phenylacetate-CoA ligase